jgi:hypothetical protein
MVLLWSFSLISLRQLPAGYARIGSLRFHFDRLRLNAAIGAGAVIVLSVDRASSRQPHRRLARSGSAGVRCLGNDRIALRIGPNEVKEGRGVVWKIGVVLEVRGVSCAEGPLAGDAKRQAGGFSHPCRIFAGANDATTLFGSYPSARACFFTVLCPREDSSSAHPLPVSTMMMRLRGLSLWVPSRPVARLTVAPWQYRPSPLSGGISVAYDSSIQAIARRNSPTLTGSKRLSPTPWPKRPAKSSVRKLHGGWKLS